MRPSKEQVEAHLMIMRAVRDGTCPGMTLQALESCAVTFEEEVRALREVIVRVEALLQSGSGEFMPVPAEDIRSALRGDKP